MLIKHRTKSFGLAFVSEKKVMFTNLALLFCISADWPNYPGRFPCPGVRHRIRVTIDMRQLCDGWGYCPDDSDEDPANCGANYG